MAFTTLIDLIEHAEHSIDITTFILGSDETGTTILAALTRKAAQGVRVRLLLDALGSFRVSKKMLAPLLANGGQYAFFMPMMHVPFRGRANLRNHRKIIIVDNATAILGGMNIAGEYIGLGLRHAALAPSVDQDLGRTCRSLPYFLFRLAICRKAGDRTRGNAYSRQPWRTYHHADSAERPRCRRRSALRQHHYGTFQSPARIWIVTPYFIPDEILLKAICIAAKRGIDVRIVIPRVSNHPLADLVRRNYLRLVQDSGATIFNFTPGMLHGKVILVDTDLGIVGSMNTDIRSFFLTMKSRCLFMMKTSYAIG